MQLNCLNYALRYIEKCFPKAFIDEALKRFDIVCYESSRGKTTVTFVPRNLSHVIESLRSRGVDIVRAGIVIGWIKGQNFVPSPHLFSLARELGYEYGCAVVVKEQGVKAFLYGNDILLSSVEKVVCPAQRGWYVAVVDPTDGTVIGIGRLLLSPEEIEEALKRGEMLRPVVKNVFDLGLAIRDEHYFL